MTYRSEFTDKVADGTNAISQRKLSSIETRGGLEAVKVRAKQKAIPLLRLEDNEGNELAAASLKPFKGVC